MKKYFEITPIAYSSFFKQLQEKYNWNISVQAPSRNDENYTICTEEPILNEIRAALNTQIKYSEVLIDLIGDAREYQ